MSLWDYDLSGIARSSFLERIPDPGTDPETGPFVCVRFNQAWHEAVCGCILQLCQPSAYKNLNEAQTQDVLARATALMNLFGFAGACPMHEEGVASLTILNGDAWADRVITFSSPFPGPPIVDVSCSNPDLVASWDIVTDSAFTITITAAVPVIADTTADVSWSADQA